jgi:tetratricopeptide (TPR) repeat protein
MVFDRIPIILLATISVLFAIGVLAICADYSAAQVAEDGPKRSVASLKQPEFVTTSVCSSCHAAQSRQWKDSHHDWAMKPASAGAVLGDFNEAELVHYGVRSRFFTRNGKYFVETEGPSGTRGTFEIKYTVGVTPLQQYLIELKGGRLQALSTAWDMKDRRWFHLYPNQRIEPSDGLHWTGPYQNWNSRCADCHSTNFFKGYDPKSDTYSSTWSEMNVGCESCHGPGQAHVEWAKNPESPIQNRFSQVNRKGLTIAFSRKDAKTEIEMCAACHSRRQSLFPNSRLPGTTFLDAFVPALLRPGLYHADGQILDEVYVYGSFAQSKMHARGVRCTDCHNPHGLDVRAEDNTLCTQCHNPQGNPRFSTLKAGTFDTPAHHFHPTGSEGAKCINCHMPARKYMVVDPRRDHAFKVPRPDLSVLLGTPNACTGCHKGKTDNWAAAQVKTWYPNGRSSRPDAAQVLAAGRTGATGAIDKLVRLAANEAHPAIVRATALDHLRRYGKEAANEIAPLLKSNEPLVRHGAVMVQGTLLPNLRAERLAPLLMDKVRAVRIAAAQQLVDVPPRLFAPGTRAALRAAIKEYQSSLLATVDYPETQMNLAGLAYRTGNRRAAESALKKALEMDRHLNEAWLRLGTLQNAAGRRDLALQTFEKGLTVLPDDGPLHNALGLLLAGQRDIRGAADHLDKASKLMPGNARARYNLALVLNRLGQSDTAALRLKEAARLAPSDADILYALAFQYLLLGQFDNAKAEAEKLLKLYPRHTGGRQLLENLSKRRSPP